MKRAMVLLAAALVVGCTPLGPREADRYFVLDAAAAPGASAQAASARAVRATPTTTAGFYDTQSIVYSRAPGTRAYYQFNHWTERPQRAIHAQLASRLEADGRREALALDTDLEEIYHDAAQAPGSVHIAITAQLVDPATRTIVARRRFSRSAPAASYDASGAVRGAREALGAILDDIVAWAGVEAAKIP